MMRLDFEKQNGLIPCIVQDVDTKKVLMLAYMNEESYKKTIETKLATYYSRSRQSLWVKGETSGHYQHVHRLRSRYNFIRGQTSWCGLSYGTLFLFL